MYNCTYTNVTPLYHNYTYILLELDLFFFTNKIVLFQFKNLYILAYLGN